MANVNAAFGLKPVRYRSGAPYAGACNIYVAKADYATALYVGDPVVRGGTYDSGYPTVTIATAGATNQITGVVIGFLPTPSIVTNGYGVASTLRYVMVADDPDLEFEVQEDSDSNAVEDTEMGLNANLASAAGNSYSHRSGWLLDSTSAGSDATFQVRILDAVHRSDNEFPANYAKLLVLINLHTERRSAVAGL